jgi:integrase
VKITQGVVAKIELAHGKDEFIVWDSALKGFGLRLRAGGKRTWILQYRVGKKQRRKTLGSWPVVSAASARADAEKDLADVTHGRDPQAKKFEHRAQASETFEAIGARFLAFKEKERKASSYDQIETHITQHWAAFNGRSIYSIIRREIAAELAKIADERGPIASNRARSTLHTFFNWLMGEGYEIDGNPVSGTNKQGSENKRKRVLSDRELVQIWKACADDDYGRVIRLLMLTGQRRDEIGSIAKSEVDLKGRLWKIPGQRTKNSESHEVPLADATLAILKAAIAREDREARDLIFGDGDAGRGFSGWSKAKAALDERIKKAGKAIAPWTIHDLRRSMATHMADELGVMPHIVEACLNHISGHKGGVAGHYNFAAYRNDKRKALDLWAAHIEAIVAGEAGSNIKSLRRGA